VKFIEQTITAGPSQNSLAACVASLFDMPIWAVPNFTCHDQWAKVDCHWKRLGDAEAPIWWERLGAFSQENHWRVMQLSNRLPLRWAGKFLRGDLGIATVHGDRCVVADLMTGEVVWDPRPEGWTAGHQLTGWEVSDWIIFVALL